MTTLLIIEDEARLADVLYDWFSRLDFQVTICHDGISEYESALKTTYDGIICDVMLPGMDGFSIVKKLRSMKVQTPILILTARVELQDKLQGFEAGAEDYLTKPFEIEELDARMKVLLRKNGKAAESMPLENFNGADFILEKNSRILKSSKNHKSVKLSGKEYTLLSYFMENFGQILSKEQILETAEAILLTGKTSGSYQNYQFEISVHEGELLIAFADTSSLRMEEKRYFILSLAAAVILGGLWIYPAWKITGKMVTPLEEANRLQKEFVMFAGHELKTPITVMKASLDMLKKEGVRSKYLNYAAEENEKMRGLVLELLDYSKLEYQEEDHADANVNLSQCAEGSFLELYSSFLLLLGICGNHCSFHSVFRCFRNGQLEVAGDFVGNRSGC